MYLCSEMIKKKPSNRSSNFSAPRFAGRLQVKLAARFRARLPKANCRNTARSCNVLYHDEEVAKTSATNGNKYILMYTNRCLRKCKRGRNHTPLTSSTTACTTPWSFSETNVHDRSDHKNLLR
ncbi:uncharacterized protein LOC111258951 isoform X2 [Varroa jacobsoni]|uniref:uncharacterized protein LOC111258951 isoform X2 n=1 Tax=Varroa jacobsoni TaxID=62625 RepID=UPI000BF97542|nr:uncharacterized protein LOC111258951 isoform X2 [Varroa jacobsoni]